MLKGSARGKAEPYQRSSVSRPCAQPLVEVAACGDLIVASGGHFEPQQLMRVGSAHAVEHTTRQLRGSGRHGLGDDECKKHAMQSLPGRCAPVYMHCRQATRQRLAWYVHGAGQEERQHTHASLLYRIIAPLWLRAALAAAGPAPGCEPVLSSKRCAQSNSADAISGHKPFVKEAVA